jgi:hypothetical protein
VEELDARREENATLVELDVERVVQLPGEVDARSVEAEL